MQYSCHMKISRILNAAVQEIEEIQKNYKESTDEEVISLKSEVIYELSKYHDDVDWESVESKLEAIKGLIDDSDGNEEFEEIIGAIQVLC